MTPQDWLTFTIGLLTVATAVVTGVKWLVKHYFQEIKSELKPNGGASLKDQVNRIEADAKSLSDKLDRMYNILLDHVSKH